MAPPVVSIYVTSLTSAPKVRQKTESLRRALKALEIPHEEYDLVNEPEAKTRWQRAKPPGVVVGLPGYLVGGEWVGTMEDFEEAVETATLPSFLKQDLDLDLISGAGPDGAGAGNTSVGEAELERLMREMTAEDLDVLAAEVGVGKDAGVGLLVKDGAQSLESVKEGEVVGSQGGVGVRAAASTLVVDAKGAGAGLGLGRDESKTDEKELDEAVGENAPVETSDSAPVADADAAGAAPASPAQYSSARRMSKEEIAEEMRRADTVEGLLQAVGLAEGKEKVD
ncbi:hypothetical protein EHS25_006562 [Saitozyma podzolica]|uniref:Uncharacterized protein n=1 Tax=Saitozyma podzolica TaxID=1890683 RepID=A0A427YS43_9TREE|nr:hypothetical protein EHS25_006562 [Saitozyma podzolica]